MRHAPRLAVLSTHPIQYYAPLFQELTDRGTVDVHVFYGWQGPAEGAYDPGFGTDVTWDVPLLEGYKHTFLRNTSSDPGTHHFRGIVTPGVVTEITRWQPDVVLVFGWNYWSHLMALHHFKGRVPVIFRGDSTLLDEQSSLRQLLRRLVLRMVYRYVDLALYVGQHNRAYFEAHGLQGAALQWVPHAIENRRFRDSEGRYRREAQAWRTTLGIPDTACTFVFAGKLSRKKAPDVILQAFRALDDERAHLIIGGSGPLEADLKARAAGHPRVHFIGFQNQSRMPVVYRVGDVVLLPSRGPGETWGLAINEAMACGRAVVASDRVGCALDLITPGVNGFVVPAGAVEPLADVMQQFIAQPELRTRMGQASEKAIAAWSIPEAARHHEAAVMHALARYA